MTNVIRFRQSKGRPVGASVDVAPVRRHIAVLRQRGMTIAEIAAASGVNHQTIVDIARGRRRGSRGGVIHTVSASTAAQITAIQHEAPPPLNTGDWRNRAACRGMAAVLFIPDDANGRAAAGDAQHATPAVLRVWAAAKRVCADCEVRAECLDAALADRERYGVWGGMDPIERRREARRRQRARRHT